MAQHTPGPWAYSPYTHDFAVYREGGGGDIALVRGTEAEHRANAALIAAAPKLLAALKVAYRRIGDIDNEVGRVLSEAIAEAEGR